MTGIPIRVNTLSLTGNEQTNGLNDKKYSMTKLSNMLIETKFRP